MLSLSSIKQELEQTECEDFVGPSPPTGRHIAAIALAIPKNSHTWPQYLKPRLMAVWRGD